MVYEVREWFDDGLCLYTDDSRVKDMAVQSPDLEIVSLYYRRPGDKQPFAWDIAGRSEIVTGVAKRFGNLAGLRRRASAARAG